MEVEPMLSTFTVTVTGPPHEAAGEANPETVRSGRENPSELYASSSRPSRLSNAARFGRRRSRPLRRVRRDSFENTDHLPAAEDPGGSGPRLSTRKCRPAPSTLDCAMSLTIRL
jgi:hypothetical protein